jgi:hypothetical protein
LHAANQVSNERLNLPISGADSDDTLTAGIVAHRDFQRESGDDKRARVEMGKSFGSAIVPRYLFRWVDGQKKIPARRRRYDENLVVKKRESYSDGKNRM